MQQGEYTMPSNENRSRLLVAGTLSLANLALVASVALAGLSAPAHAQGQNREGVAKTSKAVACPSGWSSTKNNETDTSMCFPQGTISPKIYAKKEKETCADGYYEVYRLWCSTKKP
jgi:hypothetical protein